MSTSTSSMEDAASILKIQSKQIDLKNIEAPCGCDSSFENLEMIQILKHELKMKDDKIDQLQKHVLWLETETETLQSKKKRRLSNDDMEKQLSDSKDDQILHLKKENEILKRQLEKGCILPNNEDTIKIQQESTSNTIQENTQNTI